MWKWIIGLGFFLILSCAGSGYYLVSSGKVKAWQDQYNPANNATEVRFSKPVKGELVRTISAPGTVSPRTKVDISAQVAARIISLPFREGQRVKKGDVLVRLDAEDLAAALDSAKARVGSDEAALDGVKAALENADREMRRRQELLSTKDITQEEFDRAKTDFDRTKSTYEQTLRSIDIARANLRRAQKDLDNTTIVSTIDGVVSRLDAEVGELVVVGTLNNPGSVIMQIADLGDMLMKAKVDESNISPVVGGQKCRVFINAYPGQTFNGQVERVRPTKQLDKDGTTYFETEIRVELPPENALTGMLANVDIEVQTMNDILKVPTQSIVDRALEDLPAAVTKDNDAVDRSKKFIRVVYRVIGGKAVPTPVLVGPSDLTDTVVLKGLSADDTIITGPYKALSAVKSDQAVTEMKATTGNESAPKTTSPGGPPR